MELDWARENISKDWSVTAWAAGGEIDVSHVDGITSDTLPHITEPGSDSSGSTSGSTDNNGSD